MKFKIPTFGSFRKMMVLERFLFFSHLCNLNVSILIWGVLLPDRQTLRVDSRHEDKHY